LYSSCSVHLLRPRVNAAAQTPYVLQTVAGEYAAAQRAFPMITITADGVRALHDFAHHVLDSKPTSDMHASNSSGKRTSTVSPNLIRLPKVREFLRSRRIFHPVRGWIG